MSVIPKTEEMGAAVDALMAPWTAKVLTVGAVGGGLTVIPPAVIPPIDPSVLANVPFYLGMAILAVTLLKISVDAINVIINLRRNIRGK